MNLRFSFLIPPLTAAFAAAGAGGCAHAPAVSDAALSREAAKLTMALAVRPAPFDPGVRAADQDLAALASAIEAARAAPVQLDAIEPFEAHTAPVAPKLAVLAAGAPRLAFKETRPFTPDPGFAAGRLAQAPAPAAATTFLVDLGRFESVSLARQVWSDIASDDPALTQGLRIRLSETEAGGVLLRAGPLADRALAEARCTQFQTYGMACQAAPASATRTNLGSGG